MKSHFPAPFRYSFRDGGAFTRVRGRMKRVFVIVGHYGATFFFHFILNLKYMVQRSAMQDMMYVKKQCNEPPESQGVKSC